MKSTTPQKRVYTRPGPKAAARPRRGGAVAVLLVLGLAAVVLLGATMAYLTDSRHLRNTLALGQDTYGRQAVMLSLEEPGFAAHAADTSWLLSGPDEEITYAAAQGLVPGQRIYKDPMVTNAGQCNIYLRVRLHLSDALLAVLKQQFGLRLNPQLVSGGDGYYYYCSEEGAPQPLAPEDSLYLFEVTPGRKGNYSMTVPSAWDKQQLDAFLAAHGAAGSVQFAITAQAVQCEGFSGTAPWSGVNPQAVATTRRRPHTPPPDSGEGEP